MKNLNYKKIKKIFVCTICFALLCSCNNSQKQEEIAKEKAKQQAFADSLAEITRLQELARQDSINKIWDSLAVFAWGDAKFGISVKEAQKTDAFHDFEVKKGYSSSSASIYYLIKEYDKNNPFSRIEAMFYEDRLNCVRLDGKRIECKNEEEYERKMNLLLDEYKNMIAVKYQEPIEIHDLPQFYLIRHSEKFVIYKWRINDKSISIGFEKGSVGKDYDIWCSISSKYESELFKQREDSIRLQKQEEEKNLKKKNADELNLF